jgi:hypothetical protein
MCRIQAGEARKVTVICQRDRELAASFRNTKYLLYCRADENHSPRLRCCGVERGKGGVQAWALAG